MKFSFSYYFFYSVIFLFIVSCSNDSLVNLGVVKKKANQFSVSRKAPLEMPPDMYLRPPKSENKEYNSSLNTEETDLDDILTNTKISKKNKDKNRLKEKRILKKILNTEATNLK